MRDRTPRSDTLAWPFRILPGPGGPLRHRLALLFALALLAPTVFSIYFAVDSFGEQQQRAKLTVRQLTALAGTYQRKFFEETRDQLQALADEDAIRNQQPDACQSKLQERAGQSPEFSGFALYGTGGEPVCTTSGASGNVTQSSWFRDALRYRSFTISDYTFTADTPQPAIVAAIPVFGADQSVRGVLSASIELYWLGAFLRAARLPSEGVFYLLDSRGNVLANSASFHGQAKDALPKSQQPGAGNGTENPGPVVREDLLQQVASRSLDDFEADGNDGTRRVYSSVALPYGNVILLFGIPSRTLLGWLKQDLTVRILSLAGIWLCGIGAAWIGTHRLVTRWTSSLRRMALSYANGNYSLKPDLSRAPLEIRDLGQSLMLMASQVRDRETDLRISLDQKNMLLREVHHRVKNNLQLVLSMLNIRDKPGRQSGNRDMVADIRTRIRALALVHRYLYEGDDVRHVELCTFLTDLCRMLVASVSPGDDRISLDLDIERLHVRAEHASSIGLLITEVVTNAMKHAFPDGRRGTISVHMQAQENGWARLVIADDGVGIACGGGYLPADGLGLQLVSGFVRQMGGDLRISNGDGGLGTRFEIDLRLFDADTPAPPGTAARPYPRRDKSPKRAATPETPAGERRAALPPA